MTKDNWQLSFHDIYQQQVLANLEYKKQGIRNDLQEGNGQIRVLMPSKNFKLHGNSTHLHKSQCHCEDIAT